MYSPRFVLVPLGSIMVKVCIDVQLLHILLLKQIKSVCITLLLILHRGMQITIEHTQQSLWLLLYSGHTRTPVRCFESVLANTLAAGLGGCTTSYT